MREQPHHYQVTIHTGENRLYHPENLSFAARDYALKVGPQADYIAIEMWDPYANGLAGGWRIIEVVRDNRRTAARGVS